MTRQEFLDGYYSRSLIPPEWRTPDGFKPPGLMERRVEPCDCGEDICEGWQMAYVEDDADLHCLQK